MKNGFLSGVVLAAVAVTSPAAAQYNTMSSVGWMNYNNPTSASIQSMISPPWYARYSARSIPKEQGYVDLQPRAAPSSAGKTTPLPPPPSASRRHPPSKTDFVPTSSRNAMRQFANVAPTARERAELLSTFTSFRNQLEADTDFRRNSVAHALAMTMRLSIEILSDKELPDAVYPVLARDINDLLGDTPQFNRSSSQQRQDLYDGLICTSLVMAVMYQDPSTRQQAKSVAKSVLGVLGFQV
jgi:hypothetical protein